MNFDDSNNKTKLGDVEVDVREIKILSENDIQVPSFDIVNEDGEIKLQEGESALIFRIDGSREVMIRAENEETGVPDTSLQALAIIDLMNTDDDFVDIVDENVDRLFEEILEDQETL